jgi:transposase
MDNEFHRYYVDPKTIHEELATALGSNAPSYQTIARWTKRFREGREDVNDDPRSGRPVSELTDENIELVRQVIINDPHSTYDEIIDETSVPRVTIERITHNCLKMKKITSRRDPPSTER